MGQLLTNYVPELPRSPCSPQQWAPLLSSFHSYKEQLREVLECGKDFTKSLEWHSEWNSAHQFLRLLFSFFFKSYADILR